MQVSVPINNVGIVINVVVNAKNWFVKACVMMDVFGIPVYVIVNVISRGVGEYLDYANCKCRRRLFDKLVLECENEVLNAIPINTTDAISIVDKKVTCQNDFLISIILLTDTCLTLLAMVSVSCYYYYKSCWLKKEYPMSSY